MDYLPNKYSWTIKVVIVSHPGELNEIWACFDIFAPQCYEVRDKVGNFGQFVSYIE